MGRLVRHAIAVRRRWVVPAIAALAGLVLVAGLRDGDRATTDASLAPKRLAFTPDGGPASTADLYVADADGSRRTRVTRARGNEYSPSWSPDGRQIVYRAEPASETPPEIMVVTADGTGNVNLTRTPRRTEWSPAWSPVGDTIAYSSDAADGENLDIWLMDPRGGSKRNLTRDPQRFDEYPAFSPDGRRIAYNSFDATGDFEIYVIDLDGSGKRNLTSRPGKDEWPSWSPDGKAIAYMSDRDGMDDIFVMNADGSDPTNLTRTPHIEESFPVWRADGKISFIRGTAGREPTHLWLMNADGSGQRKALENVSGPVAWTGR